MKLPNEKGDERRGGEKLSFFNRFVAWWADYFHCLKDVVRGISVDNVNILSSGLVYSTLVALIPCLTFLFVFLSSFGVLQKFLELLTELLGSTIGIDNARQLIEEISKFSNNAMSLGVFGLVSFLITGMFLVNKINAVINTIFHTKTEISLYKKFFVYFIFLVVFTFIISFSFALSSSFNERLSAKINNVTLSVTTVGILKQVGSYALWFLAFFLLLMFVPKAKVRFKSALVGSATGLIFLLVINRLFSYLIRKMVSYWTIYGTLASLLFILLYFYVMWYVVIATAELTFIYQFRPDRNTILGRPQVPEKVIAEAINLFLIIAKRFNSGEGSTSSRYLQRKMAIPLFRVQSYLLDFESGALLILINGKRAQYLPSKPVDKIKVRDIIKIIYGIETLTESEIETIGEAVAVDFCNGGLKSFGELTIEDLLERL